MRLFNHPSEIILATTNYINEGLSHPRTDNIVDFARGELLVDILGTKYSAEVVVGFTKSGECELHDVVALTPTSFKYKTRDALSVISQSNEHPQKRSSLNNSIPQNSDLSTPSEKKYDLADDDAAEEKTEKKADETLNENGEVLDEFFAAAVARAQEGGEVSAESRAERAERMIETRKTKFNKLLRQAATIQRKLEKLKKAADKSANAAEVKKLNKEYREIMMKLEDLQRELREMGYDLNAESRLIERQQKQIEAQKRIY